MAVCSKDCFNCPFPDCVCDDLDAEDYRNAKEIDKLLHPQTKQQKKAAAQQRAYREANRDKVAAQKKAYREANRDKYNAYMRSYYKRLKCTPIITESSSASVPVS